MASNQTIWYQPENAEPIIEQIQTASFSLGVVRAMQQITESSADWCLDKIKEAFVRQFGSDFSQPGIAVGMRGPRRGGAAADHHPSTSAFATIFKAFEDKELKEQKFAETTERINGFLSKYTSWAKIMRTQFEINSGARASQQEQPPPSESSKLDRMIDNFKMICFAQGMVVAFDVASMHPEDTVRMIFDILNEGQFAFNLADFENGWQGNTIPQLDLPDWVFNTIVENRYETDVLRRKLNDTANRFGSMTIKMIRATRSI